MKETEVHFQKDSQRSMSQQWTGASLNHQVYSGWWSIVMVVITDGGVLWQGDREHWLLLSSVNLQVWVKSFFPSIYSVGIIKQDIFPQ